MWTWAHVVKFEPSLSCISHVNKVMVQHAKSLTRQLKANQIIQIGITREPTEDIHNIIDKDSSVTCTGRWNGPSTLQLSPFSRRNVKRPSVVIVTWVAITTESTKIYITRVESECDGHRHNDTVFGGYRNVTGPRKGLLISGCGFI
jgi:hypothetical protein